MIRHYEDFEVVVTKRDDQIYADLGEAPGGRNLTQAIPITLPRGHDVWAEVRNGRKTEVELAELGHQLFGALITGELGDNWHACLGEMRQRPETGLRLRFSLQAEALTEVPLELLCKRTTPTREFLALDPLTPIVRSPRQGAAVRERPIRMPLKMLVVIANPRLQVPINCAVERTCLEKALADLLLTGRLKVNYLGIESQPGADYDTLHSSLVQAKYPYDVVHFICHGALPDAHDRESEGVLLLVDPQTGRRQDVRASDLAGILAPNGVRVVVLQACDGARAGTQNVFQGVAQRLIAGGLPAAVAMQCPVHKDIATCFCGQLYHYWLAESGLPLERAVTEARQAVRQRFPERASAWWTPVLFIRLESTRVLNVEVDKGQPDQTPESVPGAGSLEAYLSSLAQVREYARWADRPHVRDEGDDHYIQTESRILPLHASPYDDYTSQQREGLLKTIRTHNRLLVLGEPGVGKTAALERIVWETATNNKKAVIPIHLALSYYSGDLLAEVQDALERTGVLQFNTPGDVHSFLRRHQCLILFDGLNEVRRDQRRQIVGEIADFVRAYRRHYYVFTSRSQDTLWQTLRDNGIIRNVVVVRPIADEQVREYLIAHFGSRKGGQTHDSLNRPLHSMARTPLFLWMLKEVILEGGELPGNRGELFDEFIEKAVFTRDEAVLQLSIPRAAKKQALAHLALTWQEEHRVAGLEEEALAVVSGADMQCDPQVLIREARMHGLLKGKRQVRFMHQAVQEYFVALALREVVAAEVSNPAWQRLGKRMMRIGLAAQARDPWWAESFVQLAGLTKYASWLAQMIAKVNPWLAFWCMIEGREVDEETREIVEASTVNLLHSEDIRERQKAVRALEKLENPRTAEYLVTALSDGAEEVVEAAVQGLGKLGEPAVEYLRPFLGEDEGVRHAATRALGPALQLPQLVDLGTASMGRRLAALETLGQLGDTRIVEAVEAAALWDTDLAVRQRAVEVLGQLRDTRAVGSLLVIMDSDEPSLRARAVAALGKTGDARVVEHLTKALEDSNEAVRRSAIGALGRIWELSPLVQLGHESVTVRQKAAAVSVQLRDARFIQPLIAALRDQDGVVCANVAGVLGQVGDVQAVERLISVLLTRETPAARASAAEALGKLGDRRAVEPLIATLEDQDRDVRRKAVTGLGRLGDRRAIEPLIETCKDRYMQESAVKALARIGRQAVPALIVALKNWDRDIRASAAVALGRIGGIQALEALLTCLEDDDTIVRASVAAALGQVGGAQAVEALAVSLREDKDRTVCASAATALGQIGSAEAIQVLTSTLKDKGEDEVVRRRMIGALGRIWKLTPLAQLGDEEAMIRRGAAVALGQLGAELAIEPLKATLQDSNEAVRRSATSALGRIWGLAPLVRLGSEDEAVRRDAALELGQLGDPRTLEPLVATLHDSSATVRLAAARALSQLDDERTVEPLLEALEDRDRLVRQEAARALEHLSHLAMPRLLGALRDSNYWFRRRRVAETLGQIGEPGPLIEALKHDDKYVRREAAEALARLGDVQALDPLIDVLLQDDDDYVRRKAAEALGRIGDSRAIGPLTKVLGKDDDWYVRWFVAEAMGNIGDKSVVEHLIATLKDSAWPVRWMAARALGKIGDDRAVQPLIDALLEGDGPALWTVAEALGQLEDERAVESLAGTLRDSDGDQYVLKAAVEALGQIGEPIQGPLIQVLRSGDEETRQRAIAALGRLGDARDLRPLIDALGAEEWPVRQGVMEALVRIGKTAVGPLVGALEHKDLFVRRRAAQALGQIKDPRAVQPLINALEDTASLVRREAVEALRHVNTPEARSAVRRYEETHRQEIGTAQRMESD